MFNVSNEEFMEEVAHFECVYHRKSKDFKGPEQKGQHKNCVQLLSNPKPMFLTVFPVFPVFF